MGSTARICRAASVAFMPYAAPACARSATGHPSHCPHTRTSHRAAARIRGSAAGRSTSFPSSTLQYSTQSGRIFCRYRSRNSTRTAARSHLPRPGEELVCAELVRLQRVPCAVQHRRPFVLRAPLHPASDSPRRSCRRASERSAPAAHVLLPSHRCGIPCSRQISSPARRCPRRSRAQAVPETNRTV